MQQAMEQAYASMDEARSDRLIAERFTCAECTLDGIRAIIRGRRNGFATVVSLDSDARAAFTWSAVERVMSNGGAFKS